MTQHGAESPAPPGGGHGSGQPAGNGAGTLTLTRFLQYCAQTAEPILLDTRIVNPETARDAFIFAGLSELRAEERARAGWLQYNLEVSDQTAGLYGALAATTEELLSDGLAENVFFMHKPPGFRYRCYAAPGAAPALEELCRRRFSGLAADGLVGGWHSAVYEPEERLFGGPVSMRSVHRVFTADSLAWLHFHAGAAPAESAPAMRWVLSLLMIRSLLGALAVVGWEDLDVWDKIGYYGGRVLRPEASSDERTRRLTEIVRAGWRNPGDLRKTLPPATDALLTRYEQAVTPVAANWLDGYFASPGALLGPRRAAAFTVIFHWNRAALPLHQQALLTEALATRMQDG